MADDINFFAAPPSSEPPPPVAGGSGDLMGDMGEMGGSPQPMGESGDAPIILGGDQPIVMPPPPDTGGGGGGDMMDAFAAPPPPPADGDPFAAPDSTDQPPYLGDVNEAGGGGLGGGGDAPILLGPTGETDHDGGAEPPSGEDQEPAVPEKSPMQVWNEEWTETLKTRKDEENARKAELVEAARVAMEQFHRERETKREAKMAKNREDEQAKLEAIEADLENDNSYQRVCKLIELSHDSTQQAEDVKRMRDVLILLKNDPTRAVSLGA